MTKARDIASAAPAPSTVSATEIGYLDGVSSAIQTQIDGKSGTSHNHDSTYVAKSLVDAKGDLLVGSANDTVSRLAVASTAGYVLTVDSAEATGLKWAAVPSSSGPAFRATRSSTDQSITSGAYTKLQFNVETFDTDSCYDSTTNYRFTPNKAGYYFVYLGAYFAANTGSSVILRLYKNGSVYLPNVWGSGNLAPQYASPTGSSFVYLNGSTDYIEAYGYHGGTNPVFAGEQELAQFCAFWVRS